MITHVIFDVGGVIVDTGNFPINTASFVARAIQSPILRLRARYRSLLPKLESGKATLSKLDEKSAAKVLSAYKTSVEKLFKINKEVLETALELKKKYKVGILSNIDRYLADIPMHKKIYSLFDKNLVVLSYEYGVRKPEKEIYEIFLKKAGAEPENCLFIDDNPDNVKSAKKLGIKAILYKNPRQLKKELKKYL
ncbi:HAD family phosphatase [Candidatus Microgenomates bacterium]|jgi:putative hydrolase of the HAD superfamily|nr:MAG: HAD family phosphatase [Candidatus Microgenomates bacterium]